MSGPEQGPRFEEPSTPPVGGETTEAHSGDLIETPEVQTERGPQIYVASLSDYNDGVLHGTWLDANDTADGLQAGIDLMLASSPTAQRYGQPAEEWAIHDYENWGQIRLGEYEPLETIATLAAGIARHGEAYAAWVSLVDDHQSDELSEGRFEECFIGRWVSLEEYGEDTLREIFELDIDELPGVPEALRSYVSIDVDGWTRDLRLNGEIQTVEGDGGVYVFWGSC